jgi:hypothetical protein
MSLVHMCVDGEDVVELLAVDEAGLLDAVGEVDVTSDAIGLPCFPVPDPDFVLVHAASVAAATRIATVSCTCRRIIGDLRRPTSQRQHRQAIAADRDLGLTEWILSPGTTLRG